MSNKINTFNNFFKSVAVINEVKRYINHGEIPQRFQQRHVSQQQRFINIAQEFEVRGNSLVCTETGQTVIRPNSKNARLRELYQNIRDSAGLGVQGLYDLACTRYIGITKEDCKEFLMDVPTYQVTKDYRRLINKPTVALFPNHIWTIDYVDMGERYVDRHNNINYRYILTCVDWFSKYCFVRACRTVNADELLDQMYSICYEAETVPQIIRCDNGGSFQSQQFQDWARNNEVTISYGLSYYPRSQSVIENFNRQLRKRIRDGFVRNGDLHWVNRLEDYAEAWNRRKHSTTGYEPYFLYLIDDEDDGLQLEVIERVKEKARKQVAKNNTLELEVGDWVRISTYMLSSAIRNEFKRKGTMKDVVVRWSPQKYQVFRRIEPSLARVGLQKFEYEVRDELGNPLLSNTRPRRFFATDLMKTTPPSRADNGFDNNFMVGMNRKVLVDENRARVQLNNAQVRGGNRRVTGNSNGNQRVGNYDNEEPLAVNRPSRNTRAPSHLSDYNRNLDLRRKNT